MESENILLLKAEKKDSFGGKRLLGETPNGSKVWASYKIDKKNLNLTIKTTHKLDVLLKDGAKFCPKRVTVANNKSTPLGAMRSSKSEYGEVTTKSLEYLSRLIQEAESDVNKVDGQCSRNLFMHVSNFLYEGGTQNGEVRWHDVMEAWNLPSGRYFNIYG
tara:strand:- start:704 stop:1186 length:483 start_codon:yes stop_codon:yes gene_type:complete